jgi:hypothetical protein
MRNELDLGPGDPDDSLEPDPVRPVGHAPRHAFRVAPDVILIPAAGADLAERPVPTVTPVPPPAPRPALPRRLWDSLGGSSLVAVLPLFVLWRLWLQVAYWLGSAGPVTRPAPLPRPTYAQLMTDVPTWLTRWLAWDGQHYLRTAVRGYGPPGDGRELGSAIFPLFPMAARWLDRLTPLHSGLAGLVVSHACALVFLVLLYRLGELVAGQGRGRRAVLLFLVLPTSFFLASYYAEAMLLALAALAIDAALRRRWALAALAAALASATKPHGILLAPTLLVLWLHLDRRWRQGLWLLLTPAGLLAWMGFLQLRYGDAMVWLRAQAGWQRHVGGNFMARVVASSADVLAVHPWGWAQLVLALNAAALVGGLALALLLAIDRQPALAVLTAGAVLMPLVTGSLLSMSRLALLGFPAVLWLARHLRERGPAELAWLMGGVGLGTVALGAVVAGRFLA